MRRTNEHMQKREKDAYIDAEAIIVAVINGRTHVLQNNSRVLRQQVGHLLPHLGSDHDGIAMAIVGVRVVHIARARGTDVLRAQVIGHNAIEVFLASECKSCKREHDEEGQLHSVQE